MPRHCQCIGHRNCRGRACNLGRAHARAGSRCAVASSFLARPSGTQHMGGTNLRRTSRCPNQWIEPGSGPGLLRRIASLNPSLLPGDWGAGLPRRAGLFTIDQWRQALIAARHRRTEPEAAERAVLPILELLARGTSRAEEAGKLLLRSRHARLVARSFAKRAASCDRSVSTRSANS